MKNKKFQTYAVAMYAVVLAALAFLIYETGNLRSKIEAVEYRQQLQNQFDLANIRRGALRTMPSHGPSEAH